MIRDLQTFLLTLLSDEYIFFEEGDIIWDGGHHAFRGVQFNAAKLDELQSIVQNCSDFDDIYEAAQYLVAFLSEAEKDEDLIVPREEVASGLLVPFWEGDLTGSTLALYAACAGALRVEGGAESYDVYYDVRLARGIPHFFDRVARLLWDLRVPTLPLREAPFSISFRGARNVDADVILGDVDEPVKGAQDAQALMEVIAMPQIGIDD